MSNPRDGIRRVIEAFERSEWSEIDVRSGNLRVHLSTSAPTSPPPTTPTPITRDASPVTGRPTRDDAVTPAAVGPDPSTTALACPPPTGTHVVVSPSPGILWRSPEPGLPPFADVGHRVDASATMCIVEVMKLMNHVKAGVSGEVVAVYGEDGVAVQKGQVLFAIAPSGSSS